MTKMTKMDEWRETDDMFSDLAQGAVNAVQLGDAQDALLYVRAMRGMFRKQLSHELHVDNTEERTQRKGWF
jgi:hypothetical protein